jgi:hypothetical protein
MSKTIKSRRVKSGIFKGEILKIKQLNSKEQAERYGTTHIVTLNEYDDEDYEGTLKDCTEHFNNYEN